MKGVTGYSWPDEPHIMLDTLNELGMSYPQVNQARLKELQSIREHLVGEEE